MSYIGKHVQLTINRFTSVGAYLEDGKGFEVLLPNKYLSDNMELDQVIEVFIYNDSEDRPVATTETPKVNLNEFAFLHVKAVTQFGAFLDWGLEKDLLVPFKEQNDKMQEGQDYLIRLELDEVTNRLIASAKIGRFLERTVTDLEVGDEVDLFVSYHTPLGRQVIINDKYGGMIFNDRMLGPLRNGEKLKGYVEYIRQDGKIDISLQPVGLEKFDHFSETLMNYIKEKEGVIYLTDKSDPDLIREELGMSKKSFKKAVGDLYKKRLIRLSKNSIVLIKK